MLSLIAKIYRDKYKLTNSDEAIVFESKQSVKAVTTKVKVAKMGGMTLIDSPGTNDPDKKRPDYQIQLELINTIRTLLKDVE